MDIGKAARERLQIEAAVQMAHHGSAFGLYAKDVIGKEAIKQFHNKHLFVPRRIASKKSGDEFRPE